MLYMFFDAVAKRFIVIITRSDGFVPLDQLSTVQVAYYPSTAPNMVSAVAAARTGNVDLAFRRSTTFSFSPLHEALRSTHLYVRDDGPLEQRK